MKAQFSAIFKVKAIKFCDHVSYRVIGNNNLDLSYFPTPCFLFQRHLWVIFITFREILPDTAKMLSTLDNDIASN